MKKPEILSPAGSWDTLNAAVQSGADAVYFGGHTLNARRNATNFDDNTVADAIGFCHIRGVKVYVTLNTLVFDREIENALKFAQHCIEAGADAFIIQDIGLAVLLKRAAPNIKIHASTQMSIHNLQGVESAAKLGFERVVLARELSKQELEEIALKSPIELEVFVHGALCMSVSGQCYISSMFGGRSGNRGLCAQPCRLPFCAEGGTGYDLSLKDLSLVHNINELSQMGIASLKIEGRMKRPEYVAAATDICARAVNGEKIEQQQMQNLQSVFSRSGFTQGYYNAKLGKEMFGYRKYEDVLATQDVLKGYEALYKNERPRIKVDFEFNLKQSKKTSLLAKDFEGNVAFVEGAIPEKARIKGIDSQVVIEKLSKTGGTPFFIGEIKTKIDNDLSVPVSEINNLRRQAFDIITEKRAVPKHIEFNTSIFDEIITNTRVIAQNELKIHTSMRYFNQITENILKVADIIFLPIQELTRHIKESENLIKNGLNLGVVMPRAVFGDLDVSFQKKLEVLKNLGVKDALCGNIGTFKIAQDAGFAVHGDFGLNILNRYSFEETFKFGAISCVLSFEAKLAQIKSVIGKNSANAGIIAYGRLPLMLTRNCPVKNGIGCNKDKSKSLFCAIKDQNGETLPVICDGQTSEILNTRPLWMCDKKSDIKNSGISFASFIFNIETPEEVDNIIEAWQKEQPTHQSFTRGLYYRGIE